MSLIELNREPSVRQLRQFGAASLVMLPLLTWWWGSDSLKLGGGGDARWIGGAAAVGGLLALLSWIYPKAVKPVFLGLSLLTLPIGLVMGELILLMIFFGVFLPIGFIFILLRRDGLERRFSPDAASYWRPKAQAEKPSDYFHQW